MTSDFDPQPGPARRTRVAVASIFGALGCSSPATSGRPPGRAGGCQRHHRRRGPGRRHAAGRCARAALAKGVQKRAAAPVTLTAGGRTATITPAEAGLEVDLDESIADLTGFSLNPVKVVGHLTGGASRSLRTDSRRGQAHGRGDQGRRRAAVAPKEGSIAVTGGKVAVVQPVKGQDVEVDPTVEAIASAWPRTAPFVAPVKESTPKVTG